MADVQWIKFMVGSFDGMSFKRIKKATLKDGTSYRDKLTAVWFELLDLAAKRNLKGQLCNLEDIEIPFTKEAQFEDIAIMIDRTPEEVECCITWFEKNKMVAIVDDVYMLANWEKYQEEDKLALIREQNRLRQQRKRSKNKELLLPDNVMSRDSHVIVTQVSHQNNALDKEIDKEEDIDIYSITNINITNTCPVVSQKQSDNAVISLILNNKKYFNIYQEDIDHYKYLYPAVDILQELKIMCGWLESNPANRKTEKGIKAFITRWLSKVQNKAPKVVNNDFEVKNDNGGFISL